MKFILTILCVLLLHNEVTSEHRVRRQFNYRINPSQLQINPQQFGIDLPQLYSQINPLLNFASSLQKRDETNIDSRFGAEDTQERFFSPQMPFNFPQQPQFQFPQPQFFPQFPSKDFVGVSKEVRIVRPHNGPAQAFMQTKYYGNHPDKPRENNYVKPTQNNYASQPSQSNYVKPNQPTQNNYARPSQAPQNNYVRPMQAPQPQPAQNNYVKPNVQQSAANNQRQPAQEAYQRQQPVTSKPLMQRQVPIVQSRPAFTQNTDQKATNQQQSGK